MSLFDFARKSTWLQNIVVKFTTSLHPAIMHNLGKIEVIKKAFWLCELENIEGSYFEFGVFEGSSLLAAVLAHKKNNSKISRKFYGFDSFDEGFKYFEENDKHPFFKEGDFVSSYDKVKRRLKRYPEVQLIKGYFEETVAGKPTTEICQDDKAAIVFIDCDLMGPTLVALRFVAPILQPGSILIMDDYFAYKGSKDLGTCGALQEFMAERPTISLREVCPYGYGGMMFVVNAV